jgi:putative transposase
VCSDSIYREGAESGQLTLHADRGSSMTSRTVSQLLCDLGVLQSHSRSHQSNDNPYSESQFNTEVLTDVSDAQVVLR